MKRVGQPVLPLFVMLGGLLVVYLLLPLAGLLPRLSSSSFADLLQPKVLAAAAVSAETATSDKPDITVFRSTPFLSISSLGLSR
jgi:ABC-type sulfate transport system permease component